MTESSSSLARAQDLETAKGDLRFARDAVSRLHPGFVKQRLEVALKDIDLEFQQRQQQQQQQGSATSPENTAEASAMRAPAEAAAETGGGGGTRGILTSSGMVVDSPIGAILAKAVRSRITPHSPLHAAALALHCLLLSEGFVCTGQDDKAGAVKGFAPPVREVSEDRLVPDRWDADGAAVSFRYRRPDSPRKVYLFKTAYSAERGPSSFFLGERGGKILSADVDLEPLALRGPNFMEAPDFFEHLFSVFRREVLSRVIPRKEPAGAHAGHEEERPSPVVDHRPAPPAPAPQPSPMPSPGFTEDDPLRDGPPRFAGPPGVGPSPFVPGRSGDFGGDLFPSGGGIGGGGAGMPGPGGLLGPNHPMFGGGGGSGYMEPRFDPYGPPVPGQPWGPGVPGRGGGRGDPSTDGRRGPPGGPDNDHLRPPGGPGNMFF